MPHEVSKSNLIDSGFNCPKPCYQNWSCVIKSQISGDNVYRDVDRAYFCCCTISISPSALGTLGQQLHQQMSSFHLTHHTAATKRNHSLKVEEKKEIRLSEENEMLIGADADASK